jgi:hypothetical protein
VPDGGAVTDHEDDGPLRPAGETPGGLRVLAAPSAAYDLVVDDGQALHRVRCKFCSGRDVDLRRIHSNSNGYVVKRIAADAFDWLYVLGGDRAEYLFRDSFAGRRAVTLAAKYRLGAVAESG